jgi:hypothetical protein
LILILFFQVLKTDSSKILKWGVYNLLEKSNTRPTNTGWKVEQVFWIALVCVLYYI